MTCMEAQRASRAPDQLQACILGTQRVQRMKRDRWKELNPTSRSLLTLQRWCNTHALQQGKQ